MLPNTKYRYDDMRYDWNPDVEHESIRNAVIKIKVKKKSLVRRINEIASKGLLPCCD